MTPAIADRQSAHARAVRARGGVVPPEGLPGADILDSWVRCVDAGLQATRPLVVPVVQATELDRRRERAEVPASRSRRNSPRTRLAGPPQDTG